MKPKSDTKDHQKVEVKLGSRSLIIEQCQLDNLIEALTEMNNLAADSKALINLGSA
jgi:hypothetical protein